ncbi:BREX-1 system adenine-specific DNA-methyltransferase PglX [Clostridium butyricum]|uniref:site-specific DNA-methyltransferase (adenine-specific) n=1 Tax=Clostridium butyricum TaxID=1492 RepID=A0AAP9RFS1_CLOBU|nr:BREX-1 system adenine-specific DNA-methyltransferase PglX [Clostridium butyricum]MBZ5746702.1 BREX-1 system adenine-specific DNA-methyltransferase PglX [Clostridium butyricum]MCQ2018109.1 BREX-1 system adenine-specific DNA-methyltransferase PglX [Clostridium butyricum]MCQ2022672.1 BREX-1 system adenine-specific DNA-methyltransferase PglX [Clostridium butyricum]MDI9208365.1 BREX-1 system adenine-specific DNA-methyltransferase PglX [Clostridium butyricum]NFB72957.1 BREX-1 system adenine-speci
MDKNKIKSFAVWARRKMIESVTEKAERIGITQDKIEEVEQVQGGFKLGEETFYLSIKHRNALIHEINEKGFEEVMEEVAYTWFNRFMGLRYMEVNDYLPSGVRILSSSVDGRIEPDVLSKLSEIIEELSLNGEEIYELLDSGTTSDREKAYRTILVKQCNELGKIMPQMFEKISDYTELLLPDNLLEEGSVIRKMVEDIEESDWKEEVEIIGWMYQYYISEKKDEVFAALKKNVKITKENIPAATQLFTPKWIVKYMVENSLGRLWIEGHPNDELQSEWKYYLEEVEQEPEVEEELQKIREEHLRLTPEDIKVLDPCMGSGHILVYAFDVLYEIYKTAGYSEREIPKLILKNNLYGLDIDDRAAQLASFALIMKARHYNRRLFREIEREHLELNLCSIQESNEITDEAIDYFANGNEELKNDVKYLVDVFTDAKEYGSILEVKSVDFDAIKQRLKEVEDEDNLMFGDYRKAILDNLPAIVMQGKTMSRLYEVCITNPPYMGSDGMSQKLRDFVIKEYPSSKSDMYSVFIEKTFKYTKSNYLTSLVTMHSWMFLNSYKDLRKKIITDFTINSLVQLGFEAFEGINGKVVQTVSWVSRKKSIKDFKATYIKLVDFYDSQRYRKEIEFFNNKNRYCETRQIDYLKIDGMPINYWISNKVRTIFSIANKLETLGEARQGLATGDNDKFIRIWTEVDYSKIGFYFPSTESFLESSFKYAPINKGGLFRKWYGNNESVIKFDQPSFEILSKQGNKLPSKQFYFKKGMTWTKVSTNTFSVRYCDKGYVFSDAGMKITMDERNLSYIGSLLNSKIVNKFLAAISETINYEKGNIARIPIIIEERFKGRINSSFEECINLSKNDWDSFETSWDFKVHPLLKLLDIGSQYKLSSIFNIWETECEENFVQLKSNEEELNRIFIDIYGLQDELTPEVEEKDITIRKADRTREIKSLISYAVGCMFGRYSIDAEGLIYAGGEFGDKWSINSNQCKVRSINKDDEGNVISVSWGDATFVPDKDNIIPITEDEYFEDDIVARFIEFIRTVYGEENLEENLDYIADSIGRKTSESARQAIRRYFIKDFYKDHLKIYQKRPIYWMFDSGKNDGFKCLVYMHRYNEQTIAKVRTDYLHTLQRKYEAEINRQQLVLDSSDSSAKDKAVAKKKIDRINKQIEECKEYDEVVAYFANEKISIDLDDGVKVNYAKFQDVKVINSKNKEVKMNLLAKI